MLHINKAIEQHAIESLIQCIGLVSRRAVVGSNLESEFVIPVSNGPSDILVKLRAKHSRL
jgi:hypothetical protein